MGCVFVDIPISNDAEALLQDRVLVLRGVGSRHDDVAIVTLNAGRYISFFAIVDVEASRGHLPLCVVVYEIIENISQILVLGDVM